MGFRFYRRIEIQYTPLASGPVGAMEASKIAAIEEVKPVAADPAGPRIPFAQNRPIMVGVNR